MTDGVKHCFNKHRWLVGVFLFFAVAVPHAWPQASELTITILGFNPKVADIGQAVQMLVSSKPYPGYSVLVDGVPVRTTTGTDPRWIEFNLPSSPPSADSVQITLIAGGYAVHASLRVNPIRILSVNPATAEPGEKIILSYFPPDVVLPTDSSLAFTSSGYNNHTQSSPLQVESKGKAGTVVPAQLSAGPVSLSIVANGHGGDPFNGFRVSRRISLWWVGLGVAALLVVAFLIWATSLLSSRIQRFKLVVAPEASAAPQETTAPKETTLDVPVLNVPADLVEACLRGQCVLYAGAGLSARTGLPTWPVFVEGLLKWAETEGLIDSSFARSLEQAMGRSAGLDRVADSVVSAVLDKGATERLQRYLNETFGNTPSPSDVHRLLPDLKLAGVFTTNFDSLLERTFESSGRDLPVYVPDDIELLKSSFSVREFFVLKLYGTLGRPESLLIAPAQYLERIRADRPFNDFVQQVFHSRTLLFLGSSFAGIEAYLAPLRIRRGSQIRHYAVVAVDDSGWRADADALDRRYGIRVLPYVASAQHAELLDFVKELKKTIATSGAPVSSDESPPDTEQAAVVLTGLELHNIGPFESLELSFTRRWTVLLGDNGVGKSSILRAIAAAVAGDPAGRAGARLLRSGQTEGHISLTTKSGERYGCRVFLDSLKRPDISVEAASGLGGSTLVLAFPAIRTMAAGSVHGPELRELRQPPTADDVLPVLEALPDPRILGFKQWLVNLDYAKTKGPELAKRVKKVLDALTDTLGILLGRLKLERIEVVDNDIFVETDDGRLSLDSLSQGTISILGWVGVLVQRLHEVADIVDGRALVLLDEIDAHMHPEWQQSIIARLVQAFPLVQFIVSSHSPFLAVGRHAQEIIRFRRDAFSKKVVAEIADRDTTDMTVADVLTSYLFGLQTAVDHDLQKDVLRLRELSLSPQLSATERGELEQLDKKLAKVGIAATQADPLYGQFVAELTKQQADEVARLPPLSKRAQERQRQLTKRVAEQVFAEGPAKKKETE